MLALLACGFLVAYLVYENLKLKQRETALLDALLKRSGYKSIQPTPPVEQKAPEITKPFMDPHLRQLLIADEIMEDVELAMSNRPYGSEEDEAQAIAKFTAEAVARRGSIIDVP